MGEPIDRSDQFGETLDSRDERKYRLRLYIAGNTPSSQRAILQIRQICESRLKGRYSLEVVDIYQQPTLARGEQVVATPTLIKYLPQPLRRLVGDLSREDRILVGLDLIDVEVDHPDGEAENPHEHSQTDGPDGE